MRTCIYCKSEIPEGQERSGPDGGPACFNCCGETYSEPNVNENPNGTDSQDDQNPEEDVLDEGQSEEETQAVLNFVNAMKELQFVRLRQIQAGESDQVILKRTLPEILLMMEEQLDIAKAMAIKLEPEATLQSRFFMISALTFGLTYLSMHPVPHI